MSLTWRDVAGGGYGGGGGRFHHGNSDQLMEGIRGFNEALGAVVNRKNNRALLDIENQMALNNLSAEHQKSQMAAMQNVIAAQDQAENVAAEAEWNRASGELLKNAHQAGARPEGTQDPFRSEAYLSLSPRAQALGAGLMAEQIIAGRKFGSEDEARKESSSIAGETLKIAQAEAKRREAEYLRLLEASKDPLADVDPASRERLEVARQKAASDYAKYSGADHENDDITKNKNIDSATMWSTWYKVQDRLAEEGLGEAPPGVLKRFVSEVGKDSGRDVEDALYKMSLAYHRANQYNSLLADELASAYSDPKNYRMSPGLNTELLNKSQSIGRPKVQNAPAAPQQPPQYQGPWDSYMRE